MEMEIVLSIVGGFGCIALSVNAFFLKGIYTKQMDIELKVTTLIVKEKEKSRRLDKSDDERKEIFQRLNEVEKNQ